MIIRLLANVVVIAVVAMVGCGLEDTDYKYGGGFLVERAEHNGQAAEINSNGEKVIVKIVGLRFSFTPVWRSEGYRVGLVMDLPSAVEVVDLEIKAPYLSDLKPLSSVSTMTEALTHPWFYLQKEGKEVQGISFPLRLESDAVLGLSTKRFDQHNDPHAFLLILKVNGESHRIRITGRRKV